MRASLVIFSSLPLVGGHTIITLKLCEVLSRHFKRTRVIVKDMPGHGHSEAAVASLRAMGAEVTLLAPGKAALLSLILSHQRPDVFLTIGMRHVSPLLAVFLRPRQSLYYHITHELTGAQRRQLGLYHRAFSDLVFISPATWRDYASDAPTRKDIHWAVQPTQVAAELPALPSSGQGPVRFGFMGRLNEAKGSGLLAEFIQAASSACELHVAGRGEYEEKFVALARREDTPGRVFFLGAFDADRRTQFLADFFSRIDYLCVPSLDQREGVPTVILEALQHGVPVLATDTGGTRSFGMDEFGPAAPEVVRLVKPADYPRVLGELAGRAQPEELVRQRCQEYYRAYFSDAVLGRRWQGIVEKP